MGALVVLLDLRTDRRVQSGLGAITGYAKAEVKGRVRGLSAAAGGEQSVMAVFERLRAGDFPNQFENHWVSRAAKRA